MRSSADLSLDDYLLDLLGDQKHSASRFGLYVTTFSLVLLFILGVSLSHFILTETYKTEMNRVENIMATVKHDAEAQLSDLAQAINYFTPELAVENPTDFSCSSLNALFRAHPSLAELSIIGKDEAVNASCANPSVYGELLRPVGTRILDSIQLNAIAKTRQMRSSVYSGIYLNESAIGNPFVDIVLPIDESLSRLAIGRVALSVIRESQHRLIGSKHTLSLNSDGAIVWPRQPPLQPNDLSLSSTVPPLPSNVTLTISSNSTQLMTNSRLVWSLFGLLGVMLVSILLGLRYQYRQLKTEEQLSSRIVLQQAMSQAFSNGICVTDPLGRILYVNTAFEVMFGYNKSDILNTVPPYPYWLNEDVARLFDELTKRSEGISNPHDLRFVALRKDGSFFDCFAQTRPILDGDKKVLGYLIIYQDETESNQAKLSVSRAYDSVTRILESISAAVSVIRLDGNEPVSLFTNQHYIDTFGPDPHAHARLSALVPLTNDNDNANEVFDEETKRWFIVKIKDITWIDGACVSLLSATDITLKKQAQALLDEQLKNAEHTARLITMGEMASSLAHELNQPLAAIQNYAAGALTLHRSNKLKPENLDEAFDRIITQTQRAAQVMRHIRGYAKRRDSTLTITPIERILDGTLELSRITAKKLNVAINVDIEKDLPPVMCDAVQIEQVLLNLLRNAMEASLPTSSREIVLHVSSKHQRVFFDVIDYGQGISDDVKEKLFTPFFTTKSSGMGIGLNICRTIVESHHGRLTYQDNPEGGTTFRLSLPAVNDA